MKIIGIAGGAGAGKTTLAKALQEKLLARMKATEIISLDSYYFKDGVNGHYVNGKTNGQRFLDMNHPISINQPLMQQAIVSVAADILIIEGLFPLIIPAVFDQLDVSIYLDVPADIRLGRKIIRKLKEKQMPPEIVFRNYLESVRDRHYEFIEPCKVKADYVIDGTPPTSEQIERLLSQVNY